MLYSKYNNVCRSCQEHNYFRWEAAAADAFPYTGSAQITGSLAVTGSQTLSLNELGSVPTFIIQDKANNSFTVGPAYHLL